MNSVQTQSMQMHVLIDKKRKIRIGIVTLALLVFSVGNLAAQIKTQYTHTHVGLNYGPTMLYVGNFTPDVTPDDLQDLLSPAVRIKKITIIMDPSTNVSRGYGFIEMETAEEANEMMRLFSNQVFFGRYLHVMPALRMPPCPFEIGRRPGAPRQRPIYLLRDRPLRIR